MPEPGHKDDTATRAVADFLRNEKGSGLRTKEAVQYEKRVEYFKGAKLIDALVGPKYTGKVATESPVKSRAEAAKIGQTLLSQGYFHRSQRVAHAHSRRWELEMTNGPFEEDGLYTWVYEGSKTKLYLLTGLLLLGALGMCMIQAGVRPPVTPILFAFPLPRRRCPHHRCLSPPPPPLSSTLPLAPLHSPTALLMAAPHGISPPPSHFAATLTAAAVAAALTNAALTTARTATACTATARTATALPQIWPLWMKIGVWWCSVTFLTTFGVLCVVRLGLFILMWIVGFRGIWSETPSETPPTPPSPDSRSVLRPTLPPSLRSSGPTTRRPLQPP